VISSALISCAWGYFVLTGSISTIWPMFGTANQLLAGIALCVGTTFIIKLGRAKYAWVTLVPMAFVMATTLTAAWLNITTVYLPLTRKEGSALQGYVNTGFTVVIMICALIILIDSLREWIKVLPAERKEQPISHKEAARD
jgi:carbon starvation protein